jgi:hypothetical protein
VFVDAANFFFFFFFLFSKLLVFLSLICWASGATRDALGFSFAKFSRNDRALLTFAGTASLAPPFVLLTSNASLSVEGGAMWHGKRVWINEFVCNFSFLVVGSGEGGDGIAFVLLAVPGAAPSSKSVVQEAGSLGYGSGLEGEDDQGLPNSVAVEFDTFYNEPLGDPQAQHISIHSRGSYPNSANETFRIGNFGLVQDLRGKVLTATLTYRNGELSVLLSTIPLPIVKVKVDLVNELGGASEVFVGLTSSSQGDVHSLLSWTFSYTGNELDPSKCRVFGDGWCPLKVEAGVQQTFYINAVDLFNHSYFGPPPVFYALVGDAATPAVPLSNDPSTYSVTYHGVKAGVRSFCLWTPFD